MNKKRCILHIGMPKTGTSSIQESFSNYFNKENIDKTDTLYVPFKNSNHGAAICTLFGGKKHLERFYISKGRDNNYIEKVKKEEMEKLEFAISSKASTIIISGEAILTLEKEHLINLKNFLNKYCNIEVVAYIRPIYSYISSAFQQNIKHHNFKEFNIKNSYPKYKKRFEKFDNIFGENLYLWKFEAKKLYSNDVVIDFSNRLSLSFDKSKIVRVNEALSLEAVKFLYLYKIKNRRMDIKENRKLINLLKGVGSTKLIISPLLIEPLIEQNSEDIKWIENRLKENIIDNKLENKDAIKEEKDLLKITDKDIEKLKNNLQIDSKREILSFLDFLIKV